MKKKKIMTAGHIALDITPEFRNFGKKNLQKILTPGKLVEIGIAQIDGGGAAFNTGVALHILGEDAVLAAKIGDDIFGRILRDIVQSGNCPFELTTAEGEQTSYTIVLAPEGIDRIFLHNPGCNNTFTGDDINWDLVGEVGYFHFGYPSSMKKMFENEGDELLRIFKKVHHMGVITSLDLTLVDEDSEAGRCDWDKILKKVLPYVDFFVPSIEELGYMLDREKYEEWQKEVAGADITSIISLSKDIRPLAQKAIDYGCRAVLLKCGAAGMYLKTSAQEEMQKLHLNGWGDIDLFKKSYKADRVLSTKGAGDASIAAFLKSVINGCTPYESLQYAAATGACCVTAYDSVSGLEDFVSLKKRIDAGWEEQNIVKE